jgi:hypothetical protein
MGEIRVDPPFAAAIDALLFNPLPALNLTPCVLLPPVERSSPYVNQ